jgi:hypothetical protein
MDGMRGNCGKNGKFCKSLAFKFLEKSVFNEYGMMDKTKAVRRADESGTWQWSCAACVGALIILCRFFIIII